ncbi:phage tail protein [Conexibacter arvalis]|uniref:Microcystin-dependent protein n=1 Tax=Conexibacter arvalis TaxID=912552 RepID=A0A840IFH2_9ACTN|nr:tail fiber protein [Conexibacter arvalis]MBB4662971.1 microcystin-dependent protein [Conexibacter arvalis]
MADPFVAEIRIFAGNFAPRGWALCAGQLLPISQNTALFSLLGTMYGGDGKSTFALPDLRGRVPIHADEMHSQGEPGGAETVTLLQSEIASHNHDVNVVAIDPANLTAPGPQRMLAQSSGDANAYSRGPQAGTTATLAPQAVGFAGGDQPHTNMQPYLALTFIIALQGIFPPRG